MSAAYRTAPLAERDYIEIAKYIARDNPAAEQMLRRFERKFEMLARQPMIGESTSDLRRESRRVIEGAYHIYYRPVPSGPHSVESLRAIHGARDIGPDMF
ncbi:MAG: type II toxin-antitoxin system RelE/ParE family toxin [Planctomycetaceae bacterium]